MAQTQTLESRLAETLQKSFLDSATQLADTVLQGVLQNFDPFFKAVSEKTELSVDELKALFKETQKGVELQPVKAKSPPKSPAKRTTKSDANVVHCDFIMTERSKNAGNPCGAKVTVAGSTRCRRHANSKTDAEKKTANKSKAGSKSTQKPSAKGGAGKKKVEEPGVTTTVVESEAVQEETQKIDKNKFGNYMDPETNFVFAGSDTVCGKQNMETGDIMKLDDNEVAVCKQNDWEYDSSAEPYKGGDGDGDSDGAGETTEE